MRKAARAALIGGVIALMGLQPACARSEDRVPAAGADELAALRDRVAELEQRLALIDRKLAMLGAQSETELLGAADLMSDPALLLENARAAIAKNEVAVAYQLLAAIHALHPDSPEDIEAYPIAASLFVRLYMKKRFSDPGSVWVRSEPTFMFAWLAALFGEEFPRKQVDDLIKGVPYALASDFLAFAKSDPRTRDWEITIREDDGIVDAITARRREKPIPAPGAVHGD